jgi:RHS repeat-associated protein
MVPPDENPSGLGMFGYDLRFPGQVFDRETNNHYNYFRDYDPQTGRYIESDPIGLNGGAQYLCIRWRNPDHAYGSFWISLGGESV